jgi:phosphoglycerate dehydrogenase-like enzyme
MRNPEFDSDARRRGIDRLSQLGELSYYAGELTGELGGGVLGVIASGALIHPEFYEAAADLRIVARYGVGFEKVNLQLATEHGAFDSAVAGIAGCTRTLFDRLVTS